MRIRTSIQRFWGVSAMALALTACVDVPDSGNAHIPPPQEASVAPNQRPVTSTSPSAVQSEASRALTAYYKRVQDNLRANDLLRTDTGGLDTPFTARQLAENFDAIALNDEYTSIGGQFVAQTTPSALHRWDVPVRFGIEFGASVPTEQRAEDRATLAGLAARLRQATGHPVSLSARPNFHVLVLNEDERRQIGPRLAQLIPGLGADVIRSVENLPQTSYCLVIASDPADNGAYRSAVAIIRAEHPPLLRRSCFHEEMAQGMGLANDSPRARPSVFNDDEEFALLTGHDLLLLRMLYDPRLSPGMAPEIARPIATRIAYEIMGEQT